VLFCGNLSDRDLIVDEEVLAAGVNTVGAELSIDWYDCSLLCGVSTSGFPCAVAIGGAVVALEAT
jgi:hypothetical protein